MTTDPTARTLRLLAVLSRGGARMAVELADELGSTPRTIRRDIHRLRTLGYEIATRPGPGSAYALERAHAAPILLDGDDLVVLVSAVRAAAGRIEPAAADRVLAKLESLVPPLLRERIDAVDRVTDAVDAAHPPVDSALLAAVSDAIGGAGRLRFAYTKVRGGTSDRTVDPARVVVGGDGWQLVAWDLDRDDWRVFRLDRIERLERIPGVYRRRTPPYDIPPYDSVSAWFGTDFGRIPIAPDPPSIAPGSITRDRRR